MSNPSVRYIVHDVEQAIEFYTRHLDFHLDLHPAPGFAALSRDGVSLLVNQPGAGGAGQSLPDGPTPSPGGWNRLRIEVPDLASAVAELERQNCQVRGGLIRGQGGDQALVEDPSGNLVELFQPRARTQRPAAEDLSPIVHHVEVDASPAVVFDLFNAGLGAWWPLAYTFSEASFAGARVEPLAGGTWGERSLDGRELSWGEVRAVEPGRRLVLEFGIGPDRQPAPPGTSSEVEVRFAATEAGGTRVTVEHRDFARHGDGAAMLRTGLDSPQGWPLLLAELRREVGREQRSGRQQAAR